MHTGIGIAAGIFFSGGSYGCYNSPPFARGQCSQCNTSNYNADIMTALGCSNTATARGLRQPYCQLCCPQVSDRFKICLKSEIQTKLLKELFGQHFARRISRRTITFNIQRSITITHRLS